MEHSSRYLEYLQSPEWSELRDRILVRAGYLCEIGNCSRNATEVHHLTYQRLYHEEETDLVAVCNVCHDTLTDDECEVNIKCLEEGGEDCACSVCLYRKAEAIIRRRLRECLAKAINETLRVTMLRLYGQVPTAGTQYVGLRRKELPASLLCQRTGEPASLTNCTCDACLWVRAMEEDFKREEGESDDREDDLR